MDYLSKTQPNWPRFAGISTYARLPHRSEPVGNGFAVFGVPFDLGSSFCSGSRFGPSAVREASRHIRVANAFHRINIYDHVAGIDYGDAPVYPFELERSLGSIEEFVSGLVLAGTVPIGIGGDHTVSLPILRALARASGRLSLVHFDAHSDTENVLFGSRINHGTTFRRCAEEGLIDPQKSIQIGMRGSTADLSEIDQARELGFEVIDSTLMNSLSIEEIVSAVKRRVAKSTAYLSFDIDFVDPAHAPGTGTPEVGGATAREALALIRGLTDVAFAGFDLVEVSPAYDLSGITALLAANLVFEFISLIALRALRERNAI